MGYTVASSSGRHLAEVPRPQELEGAVWRRWSRFIVIEMSIAPDLGNFCYAKIKGVMQDRMGSFRASFVSFLRIPLMADSDSIPIADSVPGDGGHVARVS